MKLSFDEFWKRYENEFDWDENDHVMLAAKDAWETALAQQTQPLTDEMIEAEVLKMHPRLGWSQMMRDQCVRWAKWARDKATETRI